MARDPELEHAVMDVLWDAPAALTPAEVRARLDRKLAYTTVMTVMTRLWKKQLLEREQRGRAYAYTPAVSPDAAHAANMIDLLTTAGDAGVLAQFADQLDPEARGMLSRLLEGR
jgi:predicted transcriptional regulator